MVLFLVLCGEMGTSSSLVPSINQAPLRPPGLLSLLPPEHQNPPFGLLSPRTLKFTSFLSTPQAGPLPKLEFPREQCLLSSSTLCPKDPSLTRERHSVTRQREPWSP